MNKNELIDYIATHADIPKAAAARIVDSVIEVVSKTLKSGESVNLQGFGTFLVREHSARIGRNPMTGAPMQIAAGRRARFKAAQKLVQALEGDPIIDPDD